MDALRRDSSTYWAPPVASALATFPVCYGYMLKTSFQLGQGWRLIPFKDVLKSASKVAPILSAQLVLQMGVEESLRGLAKRCGIAEKNTKSFAFTFGSAALVGAASSWALAAVNGLSMTPPVSIVESIRRVNKWTSGAIIARETWFFVGVAGCQPLAERAQKLYGKSKTVEYGAEFLSGAFGSLLGHPFDTMLTRWQKGLVTKTFRQAMLGGACRTLSGGAFTVIYGICNQVLQKK